MSSCGSDRAALDAAARAQGVAAARLTLAPLPDDCRLQEPHASLVAGDDAVSVLKRERRGLDKANARVDRCARFHDDSVRALK